MNHLPGIVCWWMLWNVNFSNAEAVVLCGFLGQTSSAFGWFWYTHDPYIHRCMIYMYIYILTCFAVCIYIYIHLGACHWFSEVTIDRFPFFYSRWSVRIGESSQKMTKTFWFAQMHGNFVSLRQKVQPIVKAKEVKIPCMESMGDGIYWVTKSLAPWHEHFLLLWMISM